MPCLEGRPSAEIASILEALKFLFWLHSGALIDCPGGMVLNLRPTNTARASSKVEAI